MERVLRQPELSEVDERFARAFDWEGPVLFYPVRHHSPACSLHLREAIRRYRPEAVLIEGPSDASHLLPALAEDGSVPPLCIYYSYDDREGRVSEACEKYRAYYPFLSYSPEWVAVREAAALGVPAELIDLPYAARLCSRAQAPQAQYRYNEDEEFEVNRYTALMARRAGCRSFSEFWESRFELDAQEQDTTAFVRSVFALGYYMRAASPEDCGAQTGDGQREWFMAQRIAQARERYGRVLVVTGAFHVCGLLEQLDAEQPCTLKPHSTAEVASYLMPYTFQEADSRSGYSAGMPFPAYYQTVWDKLQSRRGSAYGDAALEYIVKTARYARKSQPISLPDEINAYAMTRSLAALRGKPCPGVYELLDGVRSAFVKGDIGSTATFELDFLLRLLSGMGAGSVAAGGNVPPVVVEFRALCGKYRLKTGTVERQEVTLEIIKNPAHYAKSRFLHQLLFLETGFCKLESGPDYVTGRDRNLAREQWVCRYTTQVETRLTDLSVYGATLSQVCAALIRKDLGDSMTAERLGKLLLSVQVMGVEGFYEQYAQPIADVVENDRNFVSLCRFLQSLRYLAHMQRLMDGQTQEALPVLALAAFRSAVALMPLARTATEEEEQEICGQLQSLYAQTVELPDWCEAELFEAQVDAALEDSFCNSRFYGACLAIRSKQGRLTQEEFCARVTAYLESSLSQPEQAASFICGVFLVARDVLFADGAVLERIGQVIEAMDDPTFLSVLPNLRFAFTSFLPSELHRLGRTVAARYGADGGARLTGSAAVTREQLQLGVTLDGLAARDLEKWRLC